MATKAAAKKTAKTVKAKTTKSDPAKKAPAKKKAAAKKADDKKAPKVKSTKTKAAAKKAAPKTEKKAAAKTPAQKSTAKKTPSAKSTKTAPKVKSTKTAAKPAAKKAEAKKTGTKKTASPKSTAKKAKAPAAKSTAKAKTKKAAEAKPAPAKPKVKLNVGQKPRGEKSAPQIIPSIPLHPIKGASPSSETVLKESPSSPEAKQDFKVNDKIVYPAHGVGRIAAIEKKLIAGITNELFLIEFEHEKLRLSVPTGKAKANGLRVLSDAQQIKKAVEILKGRARVKRTMWSRRAQEYEAKINSGDINAVAEVVRDLYRASDQPEQSYSERQLFEAALDRMAREVAAVNKTDLGEAVGLLEQTLQSKKAA